MFRNRVALAMVGFIVFGMLGTMAVTIPLQFGVQGAKVQHKNSPTAIASSAGSDATVPPSASPTVTNPGDPVAATDTAPTATPSHYAPTKTPISTQTIVRGTIGSVGTNSFTLNENTGGSVTVTVTSATQYQGVSGFSSLRTGMQVNATGANGAGGHFQATIVQVQPDN